MCMILVFFLLSLSFSYSQAQDKNEVRFNQLSTSNGLSNNQINSIFQDHQGFIWIGTLSGLNKYDGYEVESYYHESDQDNSLFNNAILWMEEGPDHKIWINTGDGISLYNLRTSAFESAQKYTEILLVDDEDIQKIQKDGKGDTWFVIQDRGLIRYSEDESKLVYANTSEESDIQLSSNHIADIAKSNDGNIWIIYREGRVEQIDVSTAQVTKSFQFPSSDFHKTNDVWLFVDTDNDLWVYNTDDPMGLLYLDTNTTKIKHFGEDELSSEVVRDIIQHKDGRIWVGLDHGGIAILDKNNWDISSVKNNPDNPNSLISNNVTSLFKDDKGIIWVGTAKKGISYYNQSANNFYHYKYSSSDPTYNDMSSAVQDQHGSLWIGTNGRGLLYFNPQSGNFLENAYAQHIKSKIGSDVVVSLLNSRKNQLWVGTYLEGLKNVGPDTYRGYLPNNGDGNTISSSSIWSLNEDSKGGIWIGTLNSGLDYLDLKADSIINYPSRAGYLPSEYITCIREDKAANIWIASWGGLTVYNKTSKTFKTYATADTNSNTLSNNSVTTLTFDSKGMLWIGTMGGLNKYNPETDTFLTYKVKDGLSSDIISAILEDDQHNIWVSTAKGITRITENESGVAFQTFDASDGLQGDHFSENAALKLRDGRLMFMGQNGFNLFDPKEIKINEKVPELKFTELYISNVHIRPGDEFNGRVLIDANLNYLDKLELDYEENSLAIGFLALTYFQSQKNNYQYKLEGFDDEWTDVSSDIRRANYTNLDYGNYRLRVRASNNHNVWNEAGIGIDIIIRPPWWETSWAFAAYGILIILLLYLSRQLVLRKERSRASEENERLERKRQHELDLLKIKFFTNVSHEFRTPLSLVLTPIESMIKNPEHVKLNDFKIIQRNAKRLQSLVNQLLDFRKMEAHQHVLSESNGDLVKFMQDIVESFSDLAREKEIQLSLESEIKEYYSLFDKDKMEKIMFNLLSNAFKFTLAGGRIIVALEKREIDQSNNCIIISVSDTGIGIPEDKLQYIFNRFFQNQDNGNDIINNGTGIGLSITKEFVELHNGRISVESTPQIGTSFTVELPLKDLNVVQGKEKTSVQQQTRKKIDTVDSAQHEHTVALIEDNADFRFYLKDNLKQYYNILEGANGKDAWKSILDKLPDVVITDIMMPIMDGLELCKKIKSDPRTAHIPVILLTAQSSDQRKIEGLEAGAIEYISKPFNFEILVSTINSALRFQRRVNEAQKKVEVQTSDIPIVSVDEQLVKKAVKLVEDNMSNASFTVEDMSHELGYSRGHFYQKMIKITGQTPMDFIRNIRMKYAAELLKKSQLTVSEIAYKVGYNNPKLFSRYFKSVYKMYPSEYMNKAKENNESP